MVLEREQIGLFATEVINLITSPVRWRLATARFDAESVHRPADALAAIEWIPEPAAKSRAPKSASSSVATHRLNIVGGVSEALATTVARPRGYCRRCR